MMITYQHDGVELPLGQPFECGGVAYPANWLALASSDDLTAAGIIATEVAPAEPTSEEIKASLALYANKKQARLADGGVTVNGVFIDTNERGKINLAGAVSLAQLAPSHTFDWIVSNTETVQISASDMIAIAMAVGLWTQATYTFLGSVLASINAGEITTTAGIDGLSWPSNSITS